ncbi:MAG TPA: NADH-ubiquinone oxidoreductase-F iron-sulfur binding region domain-containing protein [Candidatus Lokiarchaeia archaeon]|nr:NADH-ubiquinone oxidoreductase-F iron-sulfur binding region domain-containing protein [Candidatus Lokiarchaeia archaeon]
MGFDGVIVLEEDICVVDLAYYFFSFTQRVSCGKCVPCRIGTTRMLEILAKIKKGLATRQDLENLKTLASTVKNTSLCEIGQTATDPILTSLKYFEDEYLAHVEKKQCPALVCRALIIFEINPDTCTGCGVCQPLCPTSAIEGEKKDTRAIKQELCIQCGRCFENCPAGAIFKANRYP